MARIASIRVLLSLASIYNLYVHQMDVKIALLNEDPVKKFILNSLKALFFLETKIKFLN